MLTNKKQNIPVIDNNKIEFEAIGEEGRIHLEGTGTIHAYVSQDNESWTEIEHEEVFDDGVCEAPIKCYAGDHVRLTATTLTNAVMNWNKLNIERN